MRVFDSSPRRPANVFLAGCSLIAVLAGSSAAHAQQATPAIELDPVVIEATGTAPGDGPGGGLTSAGYVARDTTIATKTDTDVRKIPQSIGTVSREELENRNVQSLVEAARYTAGVRAGQFGFDPRFDTIYVRGFNVTDTGFYRDGLRSLGGSFSVFRHEPYLLQGVTILKGPSSMLYGSGAPGGIVNVISKRPTETPFHEIEAQVGSHSRVQGNFDLSGPVPSSENLFYRLTGVWRSADTEFIAARDDRVSIAPALTFRSSDKNTELTVLGEYTEFTSGGSAGWYTTPQGQITGLQHGDPNYKDYDGQQFRIGYEFSHRFNEHLAFRQNLRYQNVDTDMKYVSILGLDPVQGVANRYAARLVDNSEGIAVDNQLQANFNLGPVANTVLAGLDYNNVSYRYRYGFGTAGPLSLAFPNYGMTLVQPPVSLDGYEQRTRQEQLGVYVQDQIEFNRFVLTVGGRHDWLETRNKYPLSSSRSEQNDSKFTGRVGLAYLFDNGFSPYASYSTSFAPTIGTSRDGSSFKPTEGQQEEIGLRYTPSDLNLSVSAALFRIKQSSILIPDPTDPNFRIQQGEVESRGFEVQAMTSLTDSLNLTAAYTYLDMEYLNGDDRGNMPAGIPDHQFSVWGNYEFSSGFAQGVGIGFGTRVISKSWADDANTSRNPSRVLFDATLSYDFSHLSESLKGVRAQVSAKNLFDDRVPTCVNSYCYREEGRSVIGSLRYRF
ncbi:TonB-dependent siderophore receptor [Pseudochelatococcus contaminans]|uniref:Iron complex outermembrane receptor protein n=1 Tax=Pseudochelatococcus contaminans TaxID=1538103 RepID=A0A7W5Z593_9HYPH|nr:TonB-dependent siderophore receptor [Pseudochelatococcus contaminans]MBB3809949.1 iron complex outermembrane receptor protein [Pseudochelatococcus contaminans]